MPATLEREEGLEGREGEGEGEQGGTDSVSFWLNSASRMACIAL